MTGDYACTNPRCDRVGQAMTVPYLCLDLLNNIWQRPQPICGACTGDFEMLRVSPAMGADHFALLDRLSR